MNNEASRCLLHIGVPKTGSTAIQSGLKTASPALARAGIWYPGFEQNHRFLVSAFKSDPDAFDYNRMAGRKGQAVQDHNTQALHRLETGWRDSGCSKLVLSSEHCVLLEPDEITALRDYLQDMAGPTRVLVYVRNPYLHMASLIQEQVKNGARRLADCLETPPLFDYFTLIQKWTDAFGEDAIQVCAYPGDASPGGDVVTDFAVRAGIPPDLLAHERGPENPALSGAALLIADALSESAPKFSGNRVAHRYLSRITGPEFRIPQATIDLARPRAEAQIAYLADTHEIRFSLSDLTPDRDDAEDYFKPQTLLDLAQLLNELAQKD